MTIDLLIIDLIGAIGELTAIERHGRYLYATQLKYYFLESNYIVQSSGKTDVIVDKEKKKIFLIIYLSQCVIGY